MSLTDHVGKPSIAGVQTFTRANRGASSTPSRSLAQPILQHLNVRPRHEAAIARHDYSLSEAIDNRFPLLRRQLR